MFKKTIKEKVFRGLKFLVARIKRVFTGKLTVSPLRPLLAIRNLLRHTDYFNDIENEVLTDMFEKRVRQIKERNSQIVFDTYYLPKAIHAILKEDNYLTSLKMATPRATAMMMYDMATGTLDEFYRFKPEEGNNE